MSQELIPDSFSISELRLELIRISKKGDIASDDILRNVKSHPELRDIAESIGRIRHSGKTVENSLGRVEKSLKEEAQVPTKKREIVIQYNITKNSPAKAVFKLLRAGEIKIDWVVCGLIKQVFFKRCFRCFEFGHVTAN